MGSLHRNVIMIDPTDEKVLLGEILKQLQTTDPEELLNEPTRESGEEFENWRLCMHGGERSECSGPHRIQLRQKERRRRRLRNRFL